MTSTFRAACALLTTVVFLGIAVCGDARAAETIIIGTASPGGPYLAYGKGLARLLSRELGQEVTAESTQGPAQKNAQGFIDPSQELTKKRHQWLDKNFPAGSAAIREKKDRINDTLRTRMWCRRTKPLR